MKLIDIERARAGLACACTLLLGSFAFAQDSSRARVDLHFKDADIYSATFALTQSTGIKYLIAQSSDQFGLITLSMDDVSSEDALRYICDAAGAVWEVDENGVYIIRHRSSVKAPTKNDVKSTPVRVPLRVKQIKIMKADPRHLYEIFVNPGRLSLTDSVQDIGKSDFFRVQDQNKLTPPPIVVIGSGSTTQNTFYPTAGPKMEEDIQLPGAEAPQGGGFGLGGGQGGGGFGGGQGGQGGGGFGGGQGGFGQGQGGIGGGQGGLVPQGITSIIWDPTDNSFIVQGTDEAIAELEKLIAQFDNAPKQVLIKVEFITTSNSVDRALGIDWVYQRGSIFAGSRPGTFARGSDPIFINYATGNITTRLRTILTEGWGRTVTSPLVRTLNNQPVQISNSATTTIFVNSITQGPGGTIITSNPQAITATTQLNITPRINGDNTITMLVNPSLSGFGQFKRGPDGQEIPDILTQQINVVARVMNGETIALGGLTNKVDNYSQGRIPILSDLPIIGQLFRGRNITQTASELIIFVTPTIIEEGNYGLGP